MSNTVRPGSGTAMTLPRLRALLDAYGVAPSRWPAVERAEAQVLLDSSADARRMLAEATQLDALLDLTRAPAPSEALAQRLRARRFGWRGLPVVTWGERFYAQTLRWMVKPRHQLAAMAAMLAIGMLMGAGIPDGAAPEAAPPHTAAIRPLVAPAPAGTLSALSITPPMPASAVFASAESAAYSSNADPAFDAPDPFGAAAHGLDLVDGARINGIPVPRTGELFGSIPLL